MDSSWWDPARDSVRITAAGLGRHLSANVRLQLLYGNNWICYETYRTEIECPALKDPENGSVDDGDNLPGTIAKYTCDYGFKLVGSSHRLCQNYGSWTREVPICNKRKTTIALRNALITGYVMKHIVQISNALY